jgi:hypothetical protein
MKLKSVFVLTSLLLAVSFVRGQDLLLVDTVADYSQLDKTGPNLSHYAHAYFGLGLNIPLSDTTASILIPSSYYTNFGIRYKKKICNYFAVGADLTYTFSRYKLKQDSAKIIPDTILHKKEYLNFNKLGIGVYTRFNFDKRGNKMGTFLDLGATGEWNMTATNLTKDKINDYRVIVRNKGMKPYEPFTYSVFARFGINRYVLTATYRLSSMYKSDYYKKELPPFSIGLEIGFF